MSGEFTRKPPGTHRRRNASLGTGPNSSTSPPISNAKPIPNYLKPPAFSCHDACKYGHGHGFESKWRPPVRPKQRGNSGIRGVVLNPELRVSGKKNKPKREDVVNMKITPPKEDVFVDKEATFVENAVSDIVPRGRIELEMPEEKVFELSGASSVREIKVSEEEPSVNSSPVPSRDVSVPLPVDPSEDSLSMKVVVSRSDSMYDDVLSPETDAVCETPPKDKSEKVVEAKKSAKATRINGSELDNGKKGEIEQKNFRAKDDKVSFKPSVTRKTDTVPKDGPLTRPGASIQPRSREKKAMIPTNKPRLSDNNAARPSKVEGEAKVTKHAKKPVVVKPPAKSLRKLKTGKGPTSIIGNNRRNSGGSSSNSENTEEKTIYMIEDKQEVLPDSRPVKKVTQKGNKLSSASNSSVTENDRTRNKKAVPKANAKPPLPPHKMSFRRGKVIDVQAETNIPTRIRFCRAKSGNMTNKSEGAVGASKVARKKRDTGSFGGVQSTPPTGSPSVVLRHQDAPQDKNGAMASLFNHVIEETASKLAETRKSKVKALVGAFETVISLQEKSSGCPSP